MKKLSKSSLVGFALLAGGVAVAAKVIAANKEKWKGLSESQVRDKVASKMPDRVPEEKRAAVADKVVDTMRSRGLLSEESVAQDDSVAEAAEETATENSAAVQSDDEPST